MHTASGETHLLFKKEWLGYIPFSYILKEVMKKTNQKPIKVVTYRVRKGHRVEATLDLRKCVTELKTQNEIIMEKGVASWWKGAVRWRLFCGAALSGQVALLRVWWDWLWEGWEKDWRRNQEPGWRVITEMTKGRWDGNKDKSLCLPFSLPLFSSLFSSPSHSPFFPLSSPILSSLFPSLLTEL